MTAHCYADAEQIASQLLVEPMFDVQTSNFDNETQRSNHGNGVIAFDEL